MMTESQLVESTVPGSASVPENTATSSLGGTASMGTSTTRPTRASTDKQLHKRPGRTSKKSSSIPPSSNEEAVPGAVSVAGSYNGPSGGDTELEDGNYHGVRDDQQLSSLVVASELVEEEDKVPAENLEQKIQVLERQLLMHTQNIVVAESILPIHEASNANPHNTGNDNRPKGFFAKNWKWLLVLLLTLVATVSGVAVGVALQNGRTTDPVVEPPQSPSTTMPTMSVVVAPSSSPTMSLLEILQPSIVRNDADLALLNDGISPQWRALDWLSRDDIALSENQSPSILNRYVLAVLYYATSGDDWGLELGSYLQPSSVCEWNNGDTVDSGSAVGVYCRTQSSVQQIILNDFGLSGTVPWELGLLESLVLLDVSDNSLTGTLPPELGDLIALEAFHSKQSGLTGTLPTAYGKLTKLVIFAIDANDLTGSLPTEIGQIVGLQSAYFGLNAFNGTLPTEIGQLSAIQYFSVGNSNFSGTLPTELGQLTSLYQAWFQNNSFVGTVPTEFAQLSTLSGLSLEQNNMTGSVDNVFCLSQRQWDWLQTDCATVNNGSTVEIECSCCTRCFTPDGSTA